MRIPYAEQSVTTIWTADLYLTTSTMFINGSKHQPPDNIDQHDALFFLLAREAGRRIQSTLEPEGLWRPAWESFSALDEKFRPDRWALKNLGDGSNHNHINHRWCPGQSHKQHHDPFNSGFILEGQQNLKVPDKDAGDTQAKAQAKKHLSTFTLYACGFPTEQDAEHPEQGWTTRSGWRWDPLPRGPPGCPVWPRTPTITIRVKRRPRQANTRIENWSFQEKWLLGIAEGGVLIRPGILWTFICIWRRYLLNILSLYCCWILMIELIKWSESTLKGSFCHHLLTLMSFKTKHFQFPSTYCIFWPHDVNQWEPKVFGCHTHQNILFRVPQNN